jgi:hypothetical protein
MFESEEESDDELLHLTVFSKHKTKVAAKKKKKNGAEITAETTEKPPPPPPPLTSQEIEAKGTSQQVCIA